MSGLLSVACGVLLSLLLLAGGISLVRRRAGVTLMGWWAGLAVVTTVVFAVWSVRLQPIADDMQAKILAEQKRVMEKAGQKIPPWMDGGTANKVIQYSVMGIPLIFPLITAFILTSEKRPGPGQDVGPGVKSAGGRDSSCTPSRVSRQA